jgi:membrane protein YdbS with pleckstrin-like domain
MTRVIGIILLIILMVIPMIFLVINYTWLKPIAIAILIILGCLAYVLGIYGSIELIRHKNHKFEDDPMEARKGLFGIKKHE